MNYSDSNIRPPLFPGVVIGLDSELVFKFGSFFQT